MKNDDISSSSTDELDTVPDTSSPAYAGRHPLTRAFDKFASLLPDGQAHPPPFARPY